MEEALAGALLRPAAVQFDIFSTPGLITAAVLAVLIIVVVILLLVRINRQTKPVAAAQVPQQIGHAPANWQEAAPSFAAGGEGAREQVREDGHKDAWRDMRLEAPQEQGKGQRSEPSRAFAVSQPLFTFPASERIEPEGQAERAMIPMAASSIAPIVQAVIQKSCPSCGARIQNNDAFCMACGYHLRPPLQSPSPAPQPEHIDYPARIVLQKSSGEVLREYALDKPDMRIGRGPGSDILIVKDKLASRRHAVISYIDGQYLLRDEGSSNGTYVNEELVRESGPAILKDGDIVRIGGHRLLFSQFASRSQEGDADVADMPTIIVPHKLVSAAMAEIEGRAEAAQGPEEAVAALETGATRSPAASFAAELIPARIVPKQPVEHMRFTAFYPQEVAAEIWSALAVYAHVEPAIDSVYEDLEGFRGEIGEAPRKAPALSRPSWLQDLKITVVPECQDIIFNPRRVTFKWFDAWHRVSFRFFVKQALAGSAATGRVSVFAGPFLIASMELEMLFKDRSVLSTPGQGTEATAGLYRHLFTSSSAQDQLIVSALNGTPARLAHLQHIDTLRREQGFSNDLKRAIDESDVFQLFWSEHSAQSPALRAEWEYALQLKRGEGFVRPVYWDIRLPTPPPELAALHFTYLPPYTYS